MTVLVVAPHPDDEVLGCGGSLVQHVKQGADVHVLFLTSGELALPQLDPEQARRIREGEAEAAAEVLGLSSIEFLRIPDLNIAEQGDRVSSRLVDALRERAPEHIYLPHGGEEHPDHQAAETIVEQALDVSGTPRGRARRYEVWTPLTQFDYAVDISDFIDTKLAAIDCYRSQTWFDYRRAAMGLASFRGAFATRTAYAEVFAGWFALDGGES
jgi:LmbE family N-acetylglucosaminyl deacetylase